MNVADRVTSEGIVPHETMCRLMGQGPNTTLQYDVVRAAVRPFSHKSDIKD